MAESAERKADPGWYFAPGMPQAQRYWDGERWTDHIAPIAPPPQQQAGTLTIARGVALGVLVALALLWLFARYLV